MVSSTTLKVNYFILLPIYISVYSRQRVQCIFIGEDVFMDCTFSKHRASMGGNGYRSPLLKKIMTVVLPIIK